MSQRWGVELALLLLLVSAAIIVAVLARVPHGAHARRPQRPRLLMVSGMVILGAAAFAGAWAATNAADNPQATETGPTAIGAPVRPLPAAPQPALPVTEQLSQISGGRPGGQVHNVVAAATRAAPRTQTTASGTTTTTATTASEATAEADSDGDTTTADTTTATRTKAGHPTRRRSDARPRTTEPTTTEEPITTTPPQPVTPEPAMSAPTTPPVATTTESSKATESDKSTKRRTGDHADMIDATSPARTGRSVPDRRTPEAFVSSSP